MEPVDVVQVELARTRERIAELQIEERTLERVLLELVSHQPLPPTPADTPPPSQTWPESAKPDTASKPKKRAINPRITKRPKNEWTDAEVALLSERYPDVGLTGVIGLFPNHSTRSIKTKVQKLGLRATNTPKTKRLWTPDEDEILATVYPTEGLKGVQKRLPHRNAQSIYNRVSHAGITRSAPLAPEPLAIAKPLAPESKPPPAIQVPPAKPAAPARASSRRSLSFEEQLAKVQAGAGIVEVVPFRAPLPEQTLGGVTGEINL
ncbi:MAG TPA: hypothetical protein VFJ46_17640 [Xanthobacteraceae bacterium]|nr:hypothetical protein [Xanthobacteraceae bacterium]